MKVLAERDNKTFSGGALNWVPYTLLLTPTLEIQRNHLSCHLNFLSIN